MTTICMVGFFPRVTTVHLGPISHTTFSGHTLSQPMCECDILMNLWIMTALNVAAIR